MTLVLGAFGGLDFWDPPMKGIGILKGPRIRGTQTTKRPKPVVDFRQINQSSRWFHLLPLVVVWNIFFYFHPENVGTWSNLTTVIFLKWVATQPPTSLPSKDCLQDLLYAPALEVPWSMSPFFQLGAGCVEGTEETFIHSNYWDVGVHLRKLRNVPVKRDDFRRKYI